MRSGSATDVPPNFWTSSATGSNGTSGSERSPKQLTPRLARRNGIEIRRNDAKSGGSSMGKADRRARKRENRLQGQARRQAEEKRRKQRSGLIRGAIVAVIVVVAFAAIILTGHKSNKVAATTTTKPAKFSCTTVSGRVTSCNEAPPMTIDPAKHYTATVTTNVGTVVIALNPKEAPKTVNSFVYLAEHHFYDGLKFQRVAKDFVVQGGDPKGDGSGGPGYALPTEAPKNGYTAGSVAMANAGAGTTGSQFFLTWSANGAKHLGGPPYKYSILGQITKGLDVVKTMGSYAPASGDGAPTKALYMTKVTISES
jgi:cyclophilin family peptidyl-prolyl cis-trans isomerase